MSEQSKVADFCLATVVSPKSIESMLEADSGGLFKDQHLWHVGEAFFRAAQTSQQQMPLLFAVREDDAVWFSHWAMIDAGYLTELWRVITFKLAHDLGLTHACVAIDQQTGHPVARRIGKQVFKASKRQSRLIEADPAVSPDPGNTLFVRKGSEPSIVRIEMCELPCPAHDPVSYTHLTLPTICSV